MVITEKSRKIDHISLFLDIFIKHFLCAMLGNKFDREIVVGWPVSKRFYENAIEPTLKKIIVKKKKKVDLLCSYRLPPPPKKKCHSDGILFFKILAGITFIKNSIFNDTDNVALTFI